MSGVEQPPRAPVEPGATELVIGLCAVIIAVTAEHPRVLTVSLPDDTPMEGGGAEAGASHGRLPEALPIGPLDPSGDRTLELAVRRWVRASTGLELGYVEQLYTFGDRFRVPGERSGGRRVVSVAYLALIRERPPSRGLDPRWRGVYEFFPWEDWRQGRPQLIDREIAPTLRSWIDRSEDRDERAARHERAVVSFGLEGAPWDGDRVLERYELLYELGLVEEALRNGVHGGQRWTGAVVPGREMAFDHRRILATAVSRIRGKTRYRPVIFELVPELFTLSTLQRAAEALAGVRLHTQNFRRLVAHAGLVEGTGQMDTQTGGRPAELFRFRREVVRERPAPGVRLPGSR